MALTDCQAEILGILKALILDKGYPPTYIELAEIAGIYPNAVRGHLIGLEKKGYISIDPRKSRAIRIL